MDDVQTSQPASSRRVMVGIDETTDKLLVALAQYDASTKVHVVRQLVRAAARKYFGSVESAMLEVRRG